MVLFELPPALFELLLVLLQLVAPLVELVPPLLVLGLQPQQPAHLVGAAARVRLCTFRQGCEVLSVPPLHLLRFAAILESLTPVFVDRLQHDEARFALRTIFLAQQVLVQQ